MCFGTKRFFLYNHQDSMIHVKDIVAVGVIFPDGQVALQTANNHILLYVNMESMMKVHKTYEHIRCGHLHSD